MRPSCETKALKAGKEGSHGTVGLKRIEILQADATQRSLSKDPGTPWYTQATHTKTTVCTQATGRHTPTYTERLTEAKDKGEGTGL